MGSNAIHAVHAVQDTNPRNLENKLLLQNYYILPRWNQSVTMFTHDGIIEILNQGGKKWIKKTFFHY